MDLCPRHRRPEKKRRGFRCTCLELEAACAAGVKTKNWVWGRLVALEEWCLLASQAFDTTFAVYGGVTVPKGPPNLDRARALLELEEECRRKDHRSVEEFFARVKAAVRKIDAAKSA